jgi:hypothetical protein
MPQALLSLRAIFSDVVMLEAIGRDYYVRGTGIDTQDATLNDARVEAAFSVRILGPIAITVRYAVSALESRYQTITPLNQMRGTLGFTISFLGDSGFGAVEWRNPEAP